METVFTWIGSIVLPVVAIVIAIWSSRQTSKDATRQIESIKQLAENQIDLIRVQLDTVESIKRLAEIQIETTLRQIEVEIQKNKLLGQQACDEWQKIRDLNNSQLGGDESYRNLRNREIMEERTQKQIKFYRACIRSLNESSGKITELKEKLK